MNVPSTRAAARLAVCILATAMLAGCPFDKPEDHLVRGKALAAKQDHSGATIEFKNYLQSNPRSAEVRYLLGRELLAQGQARLAEIELQKAYDGKFDRDAVVPRLVESQLMQGQPEKVAPQFISIELRTPYANADLQALLGAAALAQGKPDDALRFYRSAQQYVPDHVQGRLGEARVKALRNDLDGASKEVGAVLEQHPDQFDALLLKGDIDRARDQIQPAIEAYVAALRQNPRSIAARLNLAGCYLSTNALDLAQQQVVLLKKLAPRHPGANYLDALISFSKKDYLHANDAIALSLEVNPASGVAQSLSGAISLALKQPAQAEVHLLEGVKLNPNSLYTRRLLAALYLRQRQPQKAEEVLRPALAVLPDDPNLLGLGGEVALQQGDYASASKYFERATKIDPTNTALRVRSATVDLARGDAPGGFAALEAAAKDNIGNPGPELALVVAHLGRKQYDQALVAWKELEKRQADNPVIYNLLAAIDLGRNDRSGARKALERAVELQPTFYPATANLASLDEIDGNLDAARQRYTALLAKDPNNVSGLVGLAEFEQRHGAKDDVIVPLLAKAHKAAPTAEQPIVVLTDYYASRNSLAEAMTTAQQGLADAPSSESLLQRVALLHLRSNNPDQAIATYRQLVKLRPNVPGYQVLLGRAMVQANQADVALPLFESLLRAQPDSTELQAGTVGVLLNANRTDEAARLLADIRKLAPNSPALPELDAQYKLVARQYPEAVSAYRKLSAQTPSTMLTIRLGEALAFAGNDAEARSLLGDWLKKHPDDTDARVFDANLAMHAKDYGHAAEGFRTALKTRADDAMLLNNLAFSLWERKDPAAIGFAERAHDLAPSEPTISDTLGWILVEQGKTGEGIALLEKASAAAPTMPAISLHLAKAQIKDGRKDSARSTLQALVKAAPATSEAKESKELLTTL